MTARRYPRIPSELTGKNAATATSAAKLTNARTINVNLVMQRGQRHSMALGNVSWQLRLDMQRRPVLRDTQRMREPLARVQEMRQRPRCYQCKLPLVVRLQTAVIGGVFRQRGNGYVCNKRGEVREVRRMRQCDTSDEYC